MAGAEFQAQPEAMRAVVGNIGGILVKAINTVMDLESQVLSPASFASLGSAVASANTALQGQQVQAMRTLLHVLQEVNNLVHQSANDYETVDGAVAAGYGGGAAHGAPLWSAAPGADLVGLASAGAAATGDPHSVSNVLTYLSQAGLGGSGLSFP